MLVFVVIVEQSAQAQSSFSVVTGISIYNVLGYNVLYFECDITFLFQGSPSILSEILLELVEWHLRI